MAHNHKKSKHGKAGESGLNASVSEYLPSWSSHSHSRWNTTELHAQPTGDKLLECGILKALLLWVSGKFSAAQVSPRLFVREAASSSSSEAA
jgi:endo-1,4-beta-D-glucanase Y